MFALRLYPMARWQSFGKKLRPMAKDRGSVLDRTAVVGSASQPAAFACSRWFTAITVSPRAWNGQRRVACSPGPRCPPGRGRGTTRPVVPSRGGASGCRRPPVPVPGVPRGCQVFAGQEMGHQGLGVTALGPPGRAAGRKRPRRTVIRPSGTGGDRRGDPAAWVSQRHFDRQRLAVGGEAEAPGPHHLVLAKARLKVGASSLRLTSKGLAVRPLSTWRGCPARR